MDTLLEIYILLKLTQEEIDYYNSAIQVIESVIKSHSTNNKHGITDEFSLTFREEINTIVYKLYQIIKMEEMGDRNFQLVL